MATLDIRRVLVSDSVDQACIDILKSNNIDVTVKTGLKEKELIEEIPGYDGLVVRSATKVTAPIIEAATNLKVIGRAGTGVDNIDCDAATKKGVVVINAPGGNTLSAAELTCGMIVTLSRSIPQACASMKEGRWDRKLYMGEELNGKTLALVGLGRIGREVANRMRAFGMKTIGYDPFIPPEVSITFGVEGMELEELWPKADYITVHTPLIPQTKYLINDAIFAKCRKGVKIVNCARGGIIEESALLRALESGQCGGAGLDVFEDEPTKNLDLVRHPKVISTPHLGASTKEAQQRVAVEIAEQFVELVKGNPVPGVVNMPMLPQLLSAENGAWVALGEVLGKLAAGFRGASDAVASMKVVTHGQGLEKAGGFMKAAVVEGFLKNRGVGVNIFNSLAVGADHGIKISHSHEENVPLILADQLKAAVLVEVDDGQSVHTLFGSSHGTAALLCAIDGAEFNPPVPLIGHVVLCRGAQDSPSLVRIIDALVSSGTSVNSAYWSAPTKDGATWCVINTAKGATQQPDLSPPLELWNQVTV